MAKGRVILCQGFTFSAVKPGVKGIGKYENESRWFHRLSCLKPLLRAVSEPLLVAPDARYEGKVGISEHSPITNPEVLRCFLIIIFYYRQCISQPVVFR